MTLRAKGTFRYSPVLAVAASLVLVHGACKSSKHGDKPGVPGPEVGTASSTASSSTEQPTTGAKGSSDGQVVVSGNSTTTAPVDGGKGSANQSANQSSSNQSSDSTQPNVPADASPNVISGKAFLLKNVMSGKCWDFAEGKAADVLRQTTCHGLSTQYFTLLRIGLANDFRIQNIFTPKYVQIRAGSKDNGGQVELSDGSDAVAQHFALDRKADGKYAVRSLLSSKVLDVADKSLAENAEIHQWDYLSLDNQVWQLIPAGSSTPVN